MDFSSLPLYSYYNSALEASIASTEYVIFNHRLEEFRLADAYTGSDELAKYLLILSSLYRQREEEKKDFEAKKWLKIQAKLEEEAEERYHIYWTNEILKLL